MSEKQASDNAASGVMARIASSAEYSIAGALLAVCIVVGGALWWLRPQDAPIAEEVSSSESASRATPAVDERAAMDSWQRKLGEKFSALDEQQRKQAADEEARKARQRAADEAAAEARRQAEQAAQARQQAEARMREQTAAARPTTAPVPAVAVVATSQPRQAVVTDAAIDWSSCRRPSYPSMSVERKEEGVVMIAVDLDASAKILQTRVAGSSGFARLDRVTLEAVGKCRFTPAREDGVAKASTAQVRFTWKLQ